MGNRNSRSCQPHLFHFQLARTSTIFIPPSWARDAGGYRGKRQPEKAAHHATRVPDTISALVFQLARGNLFSNVSSTFSPFLPLLHARFRHINYPVHNAHGWQNVKRSLLLLKIRRQREGNFMAAKCLLACKTGRAINKQFYHLLKKNCNELNISR